MNKRMSRKFLKDSFKEILAEDEKIKELVKKAQTLKKDNKMNKGDLKEKNLRELIKEVKI